jgi:phosphatidylethanolamine/phosphatidyl-N-methylethanolamine N-methyltransferase
MPINTNPWNRLRYTLWAPFYDIVGGLVDARRRESIRHLDLRPGERVLLVGAGTGGDLPFFPAGCRLLATDLTPAMLRRARPRLRDGMRLALMDGHELAVQTGAFDAVVLHLILAVLPDPRRCLREAARAVRSGGRIMVFDKFSPSRKPPVLLRAVNVLANALVTDVTRYLPDIVEDSGAPLVIERDEPALLGGLFRYVLMRKRHQAGC